MAFAGSERFEVTGVLGKGGMGDVFEVHDRHRDMRVAVKTLRTLDPVALYRFKREFRAVAELAHRNIVALYDLFAEGTDWFFTMELVPGAGFIEFVRAGRRLSDREPTPTPGVQGELPHVHGQVDLGRLRSALGQLAEALVALHDGGLVHRDLKPSNVRITPEGRLVLMDFGIVAERRGPALPADHAIGTPPYMAPEQAGGAPATAASDWYGYGVMLYLALTGRLPFRGSRREVLAAKQERDPPPPSALVRGVPADLDRLCRDLLARDPAQRP
ncbi:MAG TPA: serine/threonine-protein kinase, partial [Kofleriaceae bacterium]|nr:serine/threonine-protein kinase [Kofleriaceae bacterium]